MDKHTPGQWDAEGTLVMTPPRDERMRRLRAEEVPFTCRRICVTDNEAYIPQEQAEANAKLIAAAPELLEACRASYRDISGDYSDGGEYRSKRDVIKMLVDVLKKFK